MSVSIIAALTKTRIIGKNGQLPWNIPEDLKHFKQLTTGCPVIMGKNTWESLPEKFRPLPGRQNIVVSSTMNEARGAIVAKTLQDAIKEGEKSGKEVFVIGGAQMYKSAMLLADTLHLSWVKKEYEGDTYFPEINENEWNVAEEKEYNEFTYKKYTRKKR